MADEQAMTSGTNNRFKIIAGIMVALIIGGAAFYFLYWKKTPEQAAANIALAVKQHDVALFNRHVDLDSVLSRGYDDVINVSMEKEDEFTKMMAMGFAGMLKPAIVTPLKASIMRYVETGKFENQKTEPQKTETSQSPAKKNRADNFSPKEISDRTGVNDLELKGFTPIKQEGNIAIIGAKLRDKKTEKEIILDLKMKKTEEGIWQLFELSNIGACLKQLDEARSKNK